MCRDCVVEPAVKRARRYSTIPDSMAIDDRLHQTIKAGSSEPGDGDHRHPFDLRQAMHRLLTQALDRAAVALLEIPFVDPDHKRASFALDKINDAQVLLLKRR